ncbi:MAG: hypothetical protein MJ208_00855 [Bacilli bacterium]|nr:hypothetical protein [Bacilli bacterium]
MELVIKNKLMSLTGGSKVLNEKGELVYKVKGSWASNTFSKKYKKTVVDLNKKVYYKVCNKRIHGLIKRSALIYDASGNQVAKVTEGDILKGGYEIEGTTEKMDIIGRLIPEAEIKLAGKKIGTISIPGMKKVGPGYVVTHVTDQFKVTFDDPEDGPFMVALVVAIDNIIDAHQRSTRTHTAPIH